MLSANQLHTLAEQNKGVLQTAEVLKRGIAKKSFYDFIKNNEFEQVAHGVYLAPEAWADSLYFLHLRSTQAVFSHETALYFHDLADREPLRYTVTVKTGYNPSKLTADGVKVYSIKSELHAMGLTQMTTNFGHMVPCYDMERTICDVLRSRHGMEIQTIQDALRSYVKRKDKNLRQLTHYAKALRVEKILQPYLEALL